MSLADRPRLRPFLTAAPEDESHTSYAVFCRMRLTHEVVTVTPEELAAAGLFDGSRGVEEIAAEAEVDVLSLLARFEAAGFLDGPRFRALCDGPVRPPSCIGAYEGKPSALRRQLDGLFQRGAGLPGPSRPDGQLRGILAPHIDYARGGVTYTYPYRHLAERSEASLFVIVATSHYSDQRFTLTRKHFQTPLGVAETDQRYVDRLARLYGDGLFDDELGAHLPEHSIELEVVFLQHVVRRPFRIVPLLVGSFNDCVAMGDDPSGAPDISRMVEALRQAEAEAGEPVCYVISGDLAHIGPKFGSRRPVTQEWVEASSAQDLRLMRAAEQASAAEYARVIHEEKNERNICGYPPTWLALEAARPGKGTLLHYGCYVHPRGKESVSFAGVVFEK
jgi:AmmeMemoRadiSam system protein B